MSTLEFLEVTRNFKSYYKTLCDVNYYLSSDFDKEKLRAASQVISKLIFGFIQMKETTFRDMTPYQYNKEYQMFQDDFLTIIQNSGENNADFDDFTELLDELIGIANHRMNALGKIKQTKQEPVSQSEEESVSQVMENEVELSHVLVNEDVAEIVEEMNNVSAEIENSSAEVDEISDGVEDLNTEVEEISDEVENTSTEVDEISDEVENKSDHVEEVSTIVEEASAQDEKVDKNPDVVDADFEDVNESDDYYHFRPRRKRYR
jgi:archaellum component FlaC